MLTDIIDKEEAMHEASYKGNIGFQEMVQFYQKANSSERAQMENAIKTDNWKLFKKLIQKVLGTKLH